MLFLPVFVLSQNQKKETESLKVAIFELRKEGHFEDAFEMSKKLINQNKNAGDQKELLRAYIQTGNILSNLARVKESFTYLDLAREGNIDLQDVEIESKICGEYARNYSTLGFNKKAIEYFTKGIDIAKSIADPKIKKPLLQYFYSARGVVYEEENQLDASYKDLHNAHRLAPDSYSASRLAKYFTVHRENLDSAKYYLEKGKELYDTGKFPIFQKSVLLRSWGRFYFQKKDYSKAILFYEESLSISKELKKLKDVKDTHKLLYEAYKEKKDDQNSARNLEIYTQLNDSLSQEHKKILETPVKHVLREQQEVVTKKEKNYLYLLFIGIAVAGLIIFYVFRRLSKSNRKEQEDIILKSEEQTQELKLKLNESFEEVIQLAKSNSPEFWGRFQEVYPEFSDRLLSLNPDLKPSELILGAYIYLGFTTKDIAEYTFKAAKTIQNNKYNLRKRLSIPSTDDLTIWTRNQMKS